MIVLRFQHVIFCITQSNLKSWCSLIFGRVGYDSISVLPRANNNGDFQNSHHWAV